MAATLRSHATPLSSSNLSQKPPYSLCCGRSRPALMLPLFPRKSLSANKVSYQFDRTNALIHTPDGAADASLSPGETEIPLLKKRSQNGSESTTLAAEELCKNDYQVSEIKDSIVSVRITVVGASVDLAKKKIFPALFALYCEDLLQHFTIYGYARSKMTDAELRNMVSKTLTCWIENRESCGEKMEQFLSRCFYHSGQYDSQENFAELDKKLKQHEIPPDIFMDTVKCATSSASSSNGWTRVIVEKPFGRDSESSTALTKSLKQYFDEDQIFRIDHYLGKELVENLSMLRFLNLIFEPLWSRLYKKCPVHFFRGFRH